MAKLTRKRLILLKIESTYGTDSVPTGAEAILVRNLEITPVSGDVVSRDLIRPYMGNSDQLIANTKVECSFEVELAGSGVAGTAPQYGPALRACGLSQVIVASTSVTYAPVSASFESASIYYNSDGILHKVTGCRGTFTMSCNVGQIPTLQFQMTGIYNAPTDTALATPTYTNQATPLIFRDGNTSAFQFFSFAGCLASIDFNLSNNIIYRELVNCTKEAVITDRKPAGTVMIETPTLAQKDYFAAALASATGSNTFLHGTTAGNRVTFSSPQSDLISPTYGDDNSVMMLNLSYVSLPTSAGNNEFSLVYT